MEDPAHEGALPGAVTPESGRAGEAAAARKPRARPTLSAAAANAIAKHHEELLPTAVLDMVALVGALMMTMALAPLLAFSHDDLKAADQRYWKHKYNTTETPTYADPRYKPSQLMASSSSYAAAIAIIAILIAVGVRMTLAFATHLPPNTKQQLHAQMKPLVLLSMLLLATATFVAPMAYYWVGKVIMSVEYAESRTWQFAGGIIMIATLVLGALFICVFCSSRRAAAREMAEKTPAPS